MASLIRLHAEDHLGRGGIQYFTELLNKADTLQGQMTFLAEAATFTKLVKSGSVAGTRGDPVGAVATHSDGSRWRKVAVGKWERVGADPKTRPGRQKPKDVDSVRVSQLRKQLKQLKEQWHAATSRTQRARVVDKLRAVKADIRAMSSKVKVKKSEAPDIMPLAERVFANIVDELEALGEVRHVPRPVVSSLRRSLHEHRRDLRGTDPIIVEVMHDIAAGLPADQGAIRELSYLAKSAPEVLSNLGGPEFAEWAKSTIPKPSMRADEVKSIISKMPELSFSMSSVDSYIEETMMFDPRRTLTVGDYISRIHKDGGTAARDLLHTTLVKGTDFVSEYIACKLKEGA